jgi:hypothetical protein
MKNTIACSLSPDSNAVLAELARIFRTSREDMLNRIIVERSGELMMESSGESVLERLHRIPSVDGHAKRKLH